MPDISFDAVIIGGGNKALFTAVYLAKYGGMSVAIFERRHELGGGLASHEAPAPGFIGDTHASSLADWYYKPVEEDFPDFVDKGARLVHGPVTYGIITKESQDFVGLYHYLVDPNGEKTAEELARCSQKDAETYLKLFDVARPGGSFAEAYLEASFNVPPLPDELDPLDKWLRSYLKSPGCPISEDWRGMPSAQALQQLWESVPLQLLALKRLDLGGMPAQLTGALSFLFVIMRCCSQCYAVGGTHSIAHACQRILLENGGRFFTNSEVQRILIEDGQAKGIRLADGTEIGARRVIVSGVDARQLCFKLVGKERLDRGLIDALESAMLGPVRITWYTWALHELPRYYAASWNPDANRCDWTLLAARDLQASLAKERMRSLGQVPPIEGELAVSGQHSLHDSSRSPGGKHAVATLQNIVSRETFTERQWMEFKRRHAEEVVREWQGYAPNMTWDNVIGYDPITPYDAEARLENMTAPDPAIVDVRSGIDKIRPIPQLARYRTPVEKLYATGTAWNMANIATAAQGYGCYKAIADDLGLRKPWKEKGRPF